MHAEWYELVSGKKNHSEEINFWIRCIKTASEPILELGSGTGRILIPLLERGFDITGIDTSQYMMDRCKDICNTKGLKATLFKKSMLDFNLPRKFGLVILGSGGLGLFVNDKDICSLFKQVAAHLKPGSLFVYEFESVHIDDNQNNKNWVGDWINGPNDTVIAWRKRYKYNAATHIWEGLFVIEKYTNGQLIETEANQRMGRFFTVDEATQYAKSVGFENIKATNWLTDDPPSKNSKVITVRCRKPR